MKVCTDACLFGAYLADHLQKLAETPKRALDIGSGTGLLSLMLAQKTGLHFDAIEIDPAAANQARENFAASPWKERLTIIQEDVRAYSPEDKYDLIFSNPPFFEADLKSPDKGKNAAKHDTGLTLDQLIVLAERGLSQHGLFAVLLPYHRVDHFIQQAANHHLYLNELSLVKHTVAHPFFRGMLLLRRKKQAALQTEIVLKEGSIYTAEFIELRKDYYLNI